MKRKNEKGFALVLSLLLLLVMSLMGGALIVISSTDHQSNNSSDEYQQTFYVAETALLEGEKWIINQRMGPWISTSTVESEDTSGMTSDEKASWDSMIEQMKTTAVQGMSRYVPNSCGLRDKPTLQISRLESQSGGLQAGRKALRDTVRDVAGLL